MALGIKYQSNKNNEWKQLRHSSGAIRQFPNLEAARQYRRNHVDLQFHHCVEVFDIQSNKTVKQWRIN